MLHHLKNLRSTLGLSQSDIAERLNVSRQAYALYETGRRSPTLHTLRQIAEILGVNTDYLLGLSDVPGRYRALTLQEEALIDSYRCLDHRGKQTVNHLVLYENLRYRAQNDGLPLDLPDDAGNESSRGTALPAVSGETVQDVYLLPAAAPEELLAAETAPEHSLQSDEGLESSESFFR